MEFDRTFPGFRVEPITLVIQSTDGTPVTDAEVAQVRSEALGIPGFAEPNNNRANMWTERPYLDGASKDPSVRVIQNGLVTRGDAAKKIEELRALTPPRGISVSIGGTPALEQDSIHSLFDKLPLMVVLLTLKPCAPVPDRWYTYVPALTGRQHTHRYPDVQPGVYAAIRSLGFRTNLRAAPLSKSL